MRTVTAVASLLLLVAAVGCDDLNELADASIPNVVDTVTLFALTGTDIDDPSFYSVAEGQAVRSGGGLHFDFAFHIDANGQPYFLPLIVLGVDLRTGPGLQPTSLPFDEIREAPSNGYITSDSVAVSVGQTYLLRSRLVCGSLGIPKYGKLEVLELDLAERSVTARVLTDDNCGYRGLEPGIPEE